MINLLFQEPLVFFIVASALIVSLSIHEFAHAYVADRLGDSTARYSGRVTLNPLAHLDPVGTLMILFMGFGWGKPVPFNPYNLRNPRSDAALISFAGPASNFLLAGVFVVFSHLINAGLIVNQFIYLIVFYNLSLGFFNLLPIHPLDGFKVVNGLLPVGLSFQWRQMEAYGVVILLIMIATGSIGKLIQPLVGFSLMLLGFK